MTTTQTGNTTTSRDKLIESATRLFQTKGFSATSVDDICKEAGINRGSFFYYFKTKKELAGICLDNWEEKAVTMFETGAFLKEPDPLKRVYAYIDSFGKFIQDPKTIKSCLAGTLINEVTEENGEIIALSHNCFVQSIKRFETLLQAAADDKNVTIDAYAVSQLFQTTLQGSLVLYKASHNMDVFTSNLNQFKQYIKSLFGK